MMSIKLTLTKAAKRKNTAITRLVSFQTISHRSEMARPCFLYVTSDINSSVDIFKNQNHKLKKKIKI